MSTTEIIIVFSALMALIALVTIGIDWIGKPLKHRRFIPRLYRFEDEKLPVDAYGHPQLDAPQAGALSQTPPPLTPPVVYQQPPPVVVATVPEPLTAASAPPAPALASADLMASEVLDPEATLDYSAREDQGAKAPGSASTSAFSDRLDAGASGDVPVVDADAWEATGLVPDTAPGARAGIATAQGLDDLSPTTTSWQPGMALDATVNDERPSLATKAERYWRATAAALDESHFDAEAIDRMADGKAPRRRNPRTSRVESMQLTGLRRASARSDVRMSWPDSSVDPWAAS